jgi:hypothetical protein
MSYDGHSDDYQTASLGNELREIARECRTKLKDKTEVTLEPIHEFLVSLILKSDKEILNKSKLPMKIPSSWLEPQSNKALQRRP